MKSFSPGEINHLQLGSKETSEGSRKDSIWQFQQELALLLFPPRNKRKSFVLENKYLSPQSRRLEFDWVLSFLLGRKLLSMFQILLPLFQVEEVSVHLLMGDC